MRFKSTLQYSSLFLIFLLLSCNKNEIEGSTDKSNDIELVKAKVQQAKEESKIWYDKAIKKIKEKNENNEDFELLSAGNGLSSVDLVNDTAFVGLLYETINSSLNTYSYYLNQVGNENFQNFVTILTTNGIDPEQTFNNYNVQIDTFLNDMSSIFAQAAMTIQNNPEFDSLTVEQQDTVLQNAISYYFPTNNYQRELPPSGIQVSGLLQEIGDCLFDAVGGYLIGNIRIVRDIYNAISGSSLGYSFVYAMSGRIIRQSLSNAGGWIAIAAGFAWCMIF